MRSRERKEEHGILKSHGANASILTVIDAHSTQQLERVSNNSTHLVPQPPPLVPQSRQRPLHSLFINDIQPATTKVYDYANSGFSFSSTMSRLSSLLSFAAGSTMSPQNRTTDGLTRLRFTLETLPGSKKYIFTPATRCEILSELYETFWGPHGNFFLPNAISYLPVQALLSEVQTRYGFHGAGGDPPIIPGRSCGHIFTKGESCYRCK